MSVSRRAVLSGTGAILGASALSAIVPGPALAAPRGFRVHTAPVAAGSVDSCVILGERKALLVDGQLFAADAAHVIEMIAASGRELEAVFVTHAHPDHHLGLAVIKARWPDARIVAHAEVAAQIEALAPRQHRVMRQRSGDAIADRTVTVSPLRRDRLQLEGEWLEVIGPMQGDTAVSTALWVPQLGLLAAGDFAYAGTHLWMREVLSERALDGWRASLRQLEDLRPAIVVPGHRTPSFANDASAFAFTRRYLDSWEAAVSGARTAQEVIDRVRESMGVLPQENYLHFAAGAAFTRE